MIKIKSLYSLMIIMIPFSSMIKIMMGWKGIFIEPSLIIGFILFLYFRVQVRRNELILFFSYILITLIAWLNLDTYENISLYELLNHSIRLLLLIIMMSVILFFFKRKDCSGYITARSLLLSCYIQIFFSLYTFMAWKGIFYFPNHDFFVKNSFDDRFSLPVFGIIFPRFFGTTQEPAPFGLFGLTSLFFFLLNKESYKRKQGLILSSIIIIMSLSDQIFLALIPIVFYFMKQRGVIIKFITIPTIIASIFCYSYNSISSKIGMVTSGVSSFGESVGERFFYLKYMYDAMMSNPAVLLLGYGGGLFGHQLNFSFGLPITTSPMSLLVDIFSSGGLILFIIFVLYYISYLRLNFMFSFSLIIANSLQHDWKSTSFFFALAVILYFSNKIERCS